MEQKNMSSTTYTISKVIKLVHLEPLQTYQFKIISSDKTPFQYVFVDQNALDQEQIQYLTAEDGFISGEIDLDTPYYLVLRSDIPMTVSVELNSRPYSPTTKSNVDYGKYILVVLGFAFIFYFVYTSQQQQQQQTLPPKITPTSKSSLLEKLKNVQID
jgi:hypothetical protein